ncbi:MAG: hypothetical protein JSV56_03230 [Methanomassiliicoccales archaeon]|nr:MAG: hypothetical protein JSV56_03230 [Methanomassiliicoccales archaeon]
MRYNGEKSVPEGFTEKEKEEIEATVRELEHQLAFFEEFGENAFLVWKRLNEKRGFKKGKYLIKKYKIEGDDITAVKRLIKAYVDDDPKRTARPDIRIEDDKLIVESTGFCPLIESAKILKIDMKYTCPYSTRPYFLALCRAVNPSVKYKNLKWRLKGDKICREIFWIEE